MALSESQVQFVRTMSSYVKKYNQTYGINDNCVVAIVAQSCNECRYGASYLSTAGYNFFGMKAGSSWSGNVITIETREELPDGTIITITDDFRAYADFESGVLGYFQFIQSPRYQNLRDCTTPQEYLQTIKDDGWATSSSYVTNIMRVVNQIDYLVNDTPADSNPQPPQPPPPYGNNPLHYSQKIEVAYQVISGQWGDSDITIKKNLNEAGYDYNEILDTANMMRVTTSYLRNRKRRLRK